MRVRTALTVLAVGVHLMAGQARAQPPDASTAQPASETGAIQVNWLYGAFLPKDVPLEPLSGRQRAQLYVRQTFLTPGIYFKTAFFAVGDQANNEPDEWGGGFGAYGQRLASRYGQFAIGNTFSAAGNYLLGYEPRYERCRCSGSWPRIRHALVRNFVTYNRTERERRPQIAMYAGAMGAGMISAAWKPGQASTWHEGYRSALTQAAFGSVSNLVGEFAPEIVGLLKRDGGARARPR